MHTTRYFNLEAAQLVEEAVRRKEGMLSREGALVVRTGEFTGRSPKDKYIVREASSEATVHWGPVNQPMSEEHFEQLFSRMLASWKGNEVFVQDCYAGADPAYTLPLRVLTQQAWHALFARQLFLRRPALEPEDSPFTLYFAPDFRANPELDGTRSATCIAINFKRRTVLIAGTSYAGELKKAVFTILNYLLPDQKVLPMHCSANVSRDGKTGALFFGLSGTGKTTLSADPNRRLIGDDEHGWGERGIFNFEGGCYAKCIRLSREKEPQIWNAIRFGAVLENVAMDPKSRLVNYDSEELTENTRAAYPVDYIENAVIPSIAGHPSYVLFLTADAFGVLPPISRLSPEQAMYHFLNGYTAKVAGTERGLGSGPTATFSACFGAPFLPRHSQVYAKMLGQKLREHKATCYLVNTGWMGGPYGIGDRINLTYTRAMVDAAVGGVLETVPAEVDAVFGVEVPQRCPDVPSELLNARAQWRDGKEYDRAAEALRERFRQNFEQLGAKSSAAAMDFASAEDVS